MVAQNDGGAVQIGPDSLVVRYERSAPAANGVSIRQLKAVRAPDPEAEAKRHALACRQKYDDLLARTEGYRVSMEQLKIDPAYQREVERAHVERMKRDFDPLLVGTLAVSLRQGERGAKDEMYVLDGQQRLQVFQELGFGERPVDAKVWVGLTQAEEARVFLGLNSGKTINAANKLRARRVAGEAVAAEIVAAIYEAGFDIDYRNGDKAGQIAAVSSVEAVYEAAGGLERGGFERTKAALVLHRKLWSGRRNHEAALIRAAGAFTIRHYGQIKTELLVRRFQPDKMGPATKLPWSPQVLVAEGAGRFDRQPSAGAAFLLALEHDRITGVSKSMFRPEGPALYMLPEVKRARARGEC